MIAGLLLDLRHAVRLYLKTPWQSLLAILMLAAAMALVSTTAGLWSELNLSGTSGVIDDRGLVTIGRRGDMPMGTLSANGIVELERRSQTLRSVTGSSTMGGLYDIELDGRLVEGMASPVLPGFFETLQPRLALGRGLSEADFVDDGARVLVLSHGFWQRHFDGDPEVLGREFEMAEQRWRIVGVADPEFRSGLALAFWVPFRRYIAELQDGMSLQIADDFPFFRVFARRAADVSRAAVEAELGGLIDELPSPLMGTPLDAGQVVVINGLVDKPEAQRAAQRQTHLLLAAAALVAVVAAFNTGIFLLARAPARRRELALRQALGAGRRRLSGQLVIEAGILVLLATVLGLLASLWLGVMFRELALFSELRLDTDWLDLPALAFCALLAGLLTILVALVPIGLIRGHRLSEEARQVSSRPGPFQHAAGLVQLGLAGLVGAAAIGFLVHLWVLNQRDTGLNPDNVLVAPIGLNRATGSSIDMPAADAVGAFRSEVRERIAALPGVEAVSFGSPLPGERIVAMSTHDIDGQQINSRMLTVAPGFLDVLGIELLHGRDFEDDLDSGVIISRTFAETAWGKTDAIGQFLRPSAEAENERGQIIGVVEDLLYQHPDEPPEPIQISTGSGFANWMSSILVRGNPDPDLLKSRLEEALGLMMDNAFITDVQPLSRITNELTALDRARAGVTALFGITIVLMAGFGFFAMQRFLVDSGRRETAIHMALGAGPRRVRRQMFVRAVKLGLPGLIIGSLLGLIVTAWLTDDLISDQISPLAIAVLTGTGLLALMITASLQPALRAARINPGPLLREE